MLYDKKWEKKVETKADPFTLEALTAWMEKQPADRKYEWTSCLNCLVAEYLRDVTGHQDPSGHYTFHTVLGVGWPYHEVAGRQPYTFGAALDRARKLQAS